MTVGRQPRDRAAGRITRIGLPRPTAAAWALSFLGLALLGAAINTGNNLLYLLFGLIAAALPISLAGSLVNLLRIRVEMRPPAAPQAGVPFTVEIRIANSGRWLAARALRLRVVTSKGSTYGPALVEKVEAGGQVTLCLTGREPHRGPVQITGVRVSSTFPLGFLERRRFYAWPQEMLVLPSTARRAGGARGGDDHPGEASAVSRAAGTEYEGLRRGRAEDDARRVDWKSTARRGMLLVRETRGEGRPLLERHLRTLRPGEPGAARDTFEAEVEDLASRARRVLEEGGLVVLSVDAGSAEPYRGRPGLGALLRRLARLVPIDASGQPLPPARAEAAPISPPPGASARTSPAGVVHGRSALAALAVSTTALFAYGGLGPAAFSVLAVSLLVVGLARRRVRPPGPWAGRMWRLAGVVALVYFFADLIVLRHNPLSASLNLIAFIALYKLFNSRGVRDDRQILLVSLLQMILSAALTTGVSFLIPLLAWLAAVVHAQLAWTALPGDGTLWHRPAVYAEAGRRLRYGGATAVLAAGLILAGGVIFLAVPHLGTGTFATGALMSSRRSGFSETARLGDIGRIKLDTSRVMQVNVAGDGAAGELRWRGLTMDVFDGRTWSRSSPRSDWISADSDGVFELAGDGSTALPEVQRATLVQTMRMDPGGSRVLFAAATPAAVQSDDFTFLAEDGAGGVLFPGQPGRPLSYTVRSLPPPRDPRILRPAGAGDPEAVRRLYLDLPPLDPRISSLARQITAGQPTRYDAAVALERWLSGTLSYSLQVDDAGRGDPLAAFLFDGMAAHCEYFATAMVVMARAVGVPARFATGYLRGERNRFSGLYTVRQSDAHSWVEVFFPGHGWVPFDPTPPAGRGQWAERGLWSLPSQVYGTIARWWDDYVIGIDIADQARGLLYLRDLAAAAGGFLAAAAPAPGRTGRWVALAGAAALLAAALLSWRRLAGDWGWAAGVGGAFRRRRLPGFYRRLLWLLARRGLQRRPGETPGELARRAAGRFPARAAGRVRDLTDLYYRVRFEGLDQGAGVRRLARRLLGDLRRDLRGFSSRAGMH